MNWLIKLCQIKPMPTPVEFPGESPLRSNYGFKIIDDTMQQEISDIEKESYPDISYLGSGMNGLVIDLGNNKARKYTIDEREADAAQEAINNPRSFLVDVYGVFQLQKDLWAIDIEKVKSLSVDESSIVTELYREITENNAIPGYDRIESEDYDIDPKLRKKMSELYNDFALNIHNDPYFNLTDAFGDNVGFNKEGKLVLLDLGNSNVKFFDIGAE